MNTDEQLEQMSKSLEFQWKFDLYAKAHYKNLSLNGIITERGIMQDHRGNYEAYWFEGQDGNTRFDGLCKAYELDEGHKVE